MKRRDFFKCMGVVVTTLALPVAFSEVEPEVSGVDMAAEGTDATVVSLHRTNGAVGGDLGGFLVPQEYVKELMAAMKEQERRTTTCFARTIKSDLGPVYGPAV